MKLSLQSLALRATQTVLLGSALAGCGGGTEAPEQSMILSATMGGSSLSTVSYVPQSRGSAAAAGGSTNTASSMVTDVRFESTAAIAQTNVPVTFGQVFSPGHLLAGVSLTGRLDNGASIPLQLDVKAKHADGSVRHAVISAVLPTLAAGEVRTLSMFRSNASAPAAAPTASSALLASGFTAAFNATIDGVVYSASADQLIRNDKASTWLAGGNATEWHVSAPLMNSSGAQHPHLTARFAVRWYPAARTARVDVAVENNWAYEAAPRQFTYDANLIVGGKTVYTKPGLTHLHHARWRKLAWWGASTAPEVNVKHNTAYLIASRAVPNYDQSLSISETTLNDFKKEWTGASIEPMAIGATGSYMPTTGGRRDIGILPGWTVSYLLSMDKRARDVTLGTADLAGSWSTHFRDKKTGYPVSIVDYPYMSVMTGRSDTFNPATQQFEAFPDCAGAKLCDTPYTPDTAHQPNFAYVPYLVTGDYYYLEELQFWSMWSVVASHPGYRQHDKGIVASDQVRGQAWTLRTLAEAAYITPDTHPLKSHFTKFVDENLNWYNKTYASGQPSSNNIGVITNGFAMSYSYGSALAPWQDDFFTSAVGHTLELGFTKAASLLHFKTKFPIERMTSPAGCWVRSAEYAVKVRDNENSPFYENYAKVYSSSLTDLVGLECNGSAMLQRSGIKVGEIAGGASSTEGQPSIMQPALAYAADVGGSQGKAAWDLFEGRLVKPDYRNSPQFAIKPR